MTPLETFARSYRPRLIHLRCRAPSAHMVRSILADFEKSGVVISRDGVGADIAAQWCQRWGRCFVMAWHGEHRAWVVRAVEVGEVDALV